ncbi:tRNA pseudouridine(38/39) synthase-like isoform X1 [Zingiber officinale]|uniref:tRNA pseudouridine(38/39) synthase-like isoform X1 n=1 Tax=Zingiber officinale TaxID=94328 RepID=UPI001C4CCF79|nr:tRNA pseudouridine(38/39) synthase-like isoform X1 [Zingiber officinale]
MAGFGGLDLVTGLQAQLDYFRDRVEELERENKRLLFRLSKCQCSEVDVQSPTDACIGFQGGFKESKGDEIRNIENLEAVLGCLSDNFTASSNNSVRNGHMAITGFGEKLMLMNSETGEEPGLQKIHHPARRYVALKIMYFGQRFYGFASEAQMDPTIESEIFKALERTKLMVGTKESSGYSRCGRTDKGVSSSGQVISLYLRSNLKDAGGNTVNQMSTLEQKCEIDYVRVLNRVLPGDIRVVGWCPVPTDFHSRFSCLSREYRYLFWKGNLDILAMKQAAGKFIGEYDFRNFCKMDAANVNNYRRKITFFDISLSKKRYADDELWAMTVRGSAFLWHQVRCMVAVLFMIGQGLESPDVINALLDTIKTPRKPQYNMAPEAPLILRFCEFENLEFICSPDASRALHEHLKSEVQRYILQAAIFDEALNCLLTPGTHESLQFGVYFASSRIMDSTGESSGSLRKGKGHIPLLLRVTEPSYEERRNKLCLKATCKRH